MTKYIGVTQLVNDSDIISLIIIIIIIVVFIT